MHKLLARFTCANYVLRIYSKYGFAAYLVLFRCPVVVLFDVVFVEVAFEALHLGIRMLLRVEELYDLTGFSKLLSCSRLVFTGHAAWRLPVPEGWKEPSHLRLIG